MDETTTPKASEYAIGVANIQPTYETLYNKAEALVEAYDKYVAATLDLDKAKYAAAYEKAYDAISTTATTGDLALIQALSDYTSANIFSATCSSFDTAYTNRTTVSPEDGVFTWEVVEGKASQTTTGIGTEANPIVITVGKNVSITGEDPSDYVTTTPTKGDTGNGGNVWSPAALTATGVATFTAKGTTGAEDMVLYFKFVNSTKSDTTVLDTVFDKYTSVQADGTTTATVTVGNAGTSDITADDFTAKDGARVSRLVDADPANATLKSVPLDPSGTTTVYVEVIAEDGFTTAIITVTVTRYAS